MKRLFGIFDNRSLSDRKGQVAIFIALIFQLLFLFFAMVVNVGLLVHHKINLQNSVDLAAYYGAMKQSEVMNAVAHTNYQIRQSYKLLTWRYRVLGIAGVFPKGAGIDPAGGHPVSKNGNVNAGIRGGTITEDDSDTYPRSPEKLKDFYERPAFCLAFRPFDEVPDSENTCRAPAGQTIAALRTPPVVASFIGAAHTAQRVTKLANLSMQLRCEFVGPYNYVILGRFIVAFNIDQGNRKLLIYKLANGISNNTDDFLDL
ncbi:MAG TPA: pilus assembly protein TadG-related protein, partial [Pseudobdellovibrionaceae bacterium]|nr:pilus assembly protein TadG-related protein [Pseudobdellovibrionaceae bacterium]